MTIQVCVFLLHVGNQITKPEVISLLEQGEEPWSMEPAYPLQGTCPGESRPQVGERNLPPSLLFEKRAEAMRRSLPQIASQFLPRSFIPCTIFRAKIPTFLTR